MIKKWIKNNFLTILVLLSLIGNIIFIWLSKIDTENLKFIITTFTISSIFQFLVLKILKEDNSKEVFIGNIEGILSLNISEKEKNDLITKLIKLENMKK